jgi:hypothetical protein
MYGPQETNRFVEQGAFLLKAFHSEYAKNPMGRETEFWRGNLACWRGVAQDFFRERAGEMISLVRETTGLPFPHRGLMAQDGSGYLGMDLGADF